MLFCWFVHVAISRRCRAFVVVAGFEPNQFTNIFPKWQLCSEIRKCAAHVSDELTDVDHYL